MEGGDWYLPEGAAHPLWLPDGCEYRPELVDKFEAFSREFLKFPHGEKEGERVEWADFQLDFIVRPALGIFNQETDDREVGTMFICGARGWAKTTLASAMAMFDLMCRGHLNPEINLFSVSKPLADRLFKTIQQFVRADDDLMELLTIYEHTKKVRFDANGGEIVVRSGDASSEVGLNATMVVVDEVLSLRNRDLWDTAVTSFGKRKRRGLVLALTTPSLQVETFAKNEYSKAKRIMGDRKLDTTYYPVIFEPRQGADPHSEGTWRAANPAIEAGFFDQSVIEAQSRAAKLDPTALHALKVFYCAMWPEGGHTFISDTVWSACKAPISDIEKLKQWDCWFGLDMAGSSDMASLCMLWWNPEKNCFEALWRYWSTEAMFEKIDGWTDGHWRVWTQDSSVNLTISPGTFIDEYDVAERVMEDYRLFNPHEIGIDSYRGRQMNRLLAETAGLPVALLLQTGRATHASVERIMSMAEKGLIKHNGDPVTRWCVINSEIKYDSFAYPKIVKGDPGETAVRIDGVDALIMAMDRRLFWERELQEVRKKTRSWVI